MEQVMEGEGLISIPQTTTGTEKKPADLTTETEEQPKDLTETEEHLKELRTESGEQTKDLTTETAYRTTTTEQLIELTENEEQPENLTTETKEQSKDLKTETEEQLEELTRKSEEQLKNLTPETEKQSKDSTTENEEQPKDLTTETDEQLKELTTETEEQPKNVTPETEEESKDCTTETEEQSKDSTTETEEQPKDLTTETGEPQKELTTETEEQPEDFSTENENEMSEMAFALEEETQRMQREAYLEAEAHREMQEFLGLVDQDEDDTESKSSSSTSLLEDSPAETNTKETIVVPPKESIVLTVAKPCEKENIPPFTCSLYISNYNENDKPEWLDKNILREAASKVILGRMQIEDTKCGLLAAFSDPKDAKKLKDMNIAKIFKKPVQITSFVDYNPHNMHVVLLLNVPWSLPLSEIEFALKRQGIKVAHISRIRTFIRVVIANGFGYERLLREGLNFYKSTCFKAITERMATELYSEADNVIQCYRCQGFWHMASRCRNIPRCVRCGDRHALEYCPRPRTHPICCHCKGNHHAADPSCPVRQKLRNAVEMRIVLAQNKNTPSAPRSPVCSSY